MFDAVKFQVPWIGKYSSAVFVSCPEGVTPPAAKIVPLNVGENPNWLLW